jgi:hypothetical protein
VRELFPVEGDRWDRGADAGRLHEAFTARAFAAA